MSGQKRRMSRGGGFGDEFRTLVDAFPKAGLTAGDERAASWLAPYAAVVVPVASIVLALLLALALFALIRPRRKAESPTALEGSELVEEASPDALTGTMRNEIEKTIAEDPAGVSRLLEGWLAEHRT